MAQLVKNLPTNAEALGFIPGLGRSPGGGNGNPLQYPCLENFMDRGAWWPTVHKVSKGQIWLRDWPCTQTKEPSIKECQNANKRKETTNGKKRDKECEQSFVTLFSLFISNLLNHITNVSWVLTICLKKRHCRTRDTEHKQDWNFYQLNRSEMNIYFRNNVMYQAKFLSRPKLSIASR